MKTSYIVKLLTFLMISQICITDAYAGEPVRRTRSGIIIIGSGKNVRAVDPFGGKSENGVMYAEAANRYKEVFGDSIHIYCMPIPIAVAFYCPEEAKEWTSDMRAAVDTIFTHLQDAVVKVNLFDVLSAHADEPIYSRTDHHWAPLGAYYAAKEFARTAGVSFEDLSTYEADTVHQYVGTMYKFSRDIAVKNAPEDFVYYIPRDVEYNTVSIRYQVGKNNTILKETPSTDNRFFYDFEDGNNQAYLTFMHGDLNTTTVKTSTKNGRRLLILKDSFGNALPGYLFYSFEEIHVVDCRYFNKNIVTYAKDNHVTDILFANNVSHAHNIATSTAYLNYLTQ
ncbi:MAG: hypothetical protein J5720_00450 [Bacteroidaceae bacterium]|nr:hypothetical protein [Bacteroidaceae bacterium]